MIRYSWVCAVCCAGKQSDSENEICSFCGGKMDVRDQTYVFNLEGKK